MTFWCTDATSVTLTVHWQPLALGTLYEAQVALGSRSESFAPFVSSEVYKLPVLLDDLHPGTEYTIKMRSRKPLSREWSDLTDQSISCSTKPLASGQPHVMPPRVPPALDSILVSVDASATAISVQVRPVGGGFWSTEVALPSTGKVRVTGLHEATVYEVRAIGTHGLHSDVVLHRTAVPGATDLTVFRISELCGAIKPYSYTYDGGEYRRPCQPDNLYNHDTGSLLADVEFMNGVQGGRGFVPDFNDSVTSRYCVSRVDRPFADYVSCNGPDPEHYRCTCNIFIDRCIGRLDTSACHPTNASKSAHRFTPCDCSATSTATSARYIGTMPVYYPVRASTSTGRSRPPRHSVTCALFTPRHSVTCALFTPL